MFYKWNIEQQFKIVNFAVYSNDENASSTNSIALMKLEKNVMYVLTVAPCSSFVLFYNFLIILYFCDLYSLNENVIPTCLWPYEKTSVTPLYFPFAEIDGIYCSLSEQTSLH